MVAWLGLELRNKRGVGRVSLPHCSTAFAGERGMCSYSPWSLPGTQSAHIGILILTYSGNNR
jgi:hypothetical protein